MYSIVLIYRCDFYCPSFSSTVSESWIFILLIEINKKRKNSKHLTRHFQKGLSTNCGPFMVSMVMAAWFFWGSDEFPFDFDLFMCAATPCCYDCSPLGQTGALISLFMPCYTICMTSVCERRASGMCFAWEIGRSPWSWQRVMLPFMNPARSEISLPEHEERIRIWKITSAVYQPMQGFSGRRRG